MDAALILYFTEKKTEATLCFTHAVQAVMAGSEVDLDGRDYSDSDYDCRSTPYCTICHEGPLKIYL